MRNKTLNLISKITIVLILALMVFSPNLLVSKATSYTYDFKQVIILLIFNHNCQAIQRKMF